MMRADQLVTELAGGGTRVVRGVGRLDVRAASAALPLAPSAVRALRAPPRRRRHARRPRPQERLLPARPLGPRLAGRLPGVGPPRFIGDCAAGEPEPRRVDEGSSMRLHRPLPGVLPRAEHRHHGPRPRSLRACPSGEPAGRCASFATRMTPRRCWSGSRARSTGRRAAGRGAPPLRGRRPLPAPVADRPLYDPDDGALRRPRRRRRAGRLGDRDPPRARRRAACCSPTGPASRATSRAAAGSRGARCKQAPCDVTPVVERVVDTFELRLRHRHSFRRSSDEPLILMTQRRRLDAYLAEQAAAAGATFRDGVASEQIELGADRRHGDRRRRSRPRRLLVGADGANGIVARAAGLDGGIVRGVALEGNVAWELLDRRPLRADRRGRARQPRRRLRLAVPEGRPRQPRRRRLGGGGPARCATISPGSPTPTASTRDALTDVRGPPAADAAARRRRLRRAAGCCSSATRPGSSTRSRATGSTRRSPRPASPPKRSSRATSTAYAAALARVPSTTTPAPRGRRSARSTDIPAVCFWAARSPGVFGVVAGLAAGRRVGHPEEARGLAPAAAAADRAPLRRDARSRPSRGSRG